MKKTDAYLTVEAVLVLPVVLAVVVLVIYLWFFQYDRCLMEQNMGKLALRGCSLQVTDKKELAQTLYRQSEQIDPESYLAWDAAHAEITLKGNQVNIRQEAFLKFPFQGLAFWRGDAGWKTAAEYKSRRIAPMTFIRNCRKIMGGN